MLSHGMPYADDETLHRWNCSTGSRSTSDVEQLSDRELFVFQAIGSGKSTKEIADELVLSVKTIEQYRANIKFKLALSDGTSLLHRATQWFLENGG